MLIHREGLQACLAPTSLTYTVLPRLVEFFLQNYPCLIHRDESGLVVARG